MPLARMVCVAQQAYIDANPSGQARQAIEYLATLRPDHKEMVDERFAFYTGDDRWPISASVTRGGIRVNATRSFW